MGRVVQSVTCLTTDAHLTEEPGIPSWIPARSHTFVEIDHEIILWSFSSLLLKHLGGVVVSYKQNYAHKLLVNHFFKLAEEKVVR